MTEPNAIHIVRTIPAPPSAVWAALTQPALVEQWWAKGDIAAVAGREFTLDMGAFGQQQCMVIEVRPERDFNYTFGAGMLDTVISWHLEPADAGTQLTFTHAGFDLDSPMGKSAFGGMAAGWPSILDRLEAVALASAR